jgi:spore germination protein GerM
MTDAMRPQPPEQPPPNRWTAPPVVRISRRHLWIAIATGAALLTLGIVLVLTLLPGVLTRPTGTNGTEETVASGSTRRIQAALFYVTEDGQALAQVSRAVLYGATPLEQARLVAEAQVAPPPAGLRSAIPPGTIVRSLFLAGGGRAFVDLGGPIVSGHSGGSLNEALTVYAIVNALTVNIPDVTAVQILINGQQVDTLAGHLDLRYPLAKTLEWVRKGQ